MKKRNKILLWIFCALLLLYFGSALLTRCSRQQADFYDVVIVTGTSDDTPAEKLDSWLAASPLHRFWQYIATPEDQRQAVREAEESYEMEQGIIE
ncbi:MAG: hypothetical protein E7631_10600 [Ruminococcaceae bacterium]|nr:hypothetical protein [Oscillospiraceae bacterium]